MDIRVKEIKRIERVAKLVRIIGSDPEAGTIYLVGEDRGLVARNIGHCEMGHREEDSKTRLYNGHFVGEGYITGAREAATALGADYFGLVIVSPPVSMGDLVGKRVVPKLYDGEKDYGSLPNEFSIKQDSSPKFDIKRRPLPEDLGSFKTYDSKPRQDIDFSLKIGNIDLGNLGRMGVEFDKLKGQISIPKVTAHFFRDIQDWERVSQK